MFRYNLENIIFLKRWIEINLVILLTWIRIHQIWWIRIRITGKYYIKVHCTGCIPCTRCTWYCFRDSEETLNFVDWALVRMAACNISTVLEKVA